MKTMSWIPLAIGFPLFLLCLIVALQPDRDPALTGNEPAEIPESSLTIFDTHNDLLAEAADYFGNHHQAFDIIRDEWEVSSGFFASDTDAKAIKTGLGEYGVDIVRRLNEQAYLRSLTYYTGTANQASALLFCFCTRTPGESKLIYIYEDQPSKTEKAISRLSDDHGRLVPLSAPGWYYAVSIVSGTQNKVGCTNVNSCVPSLHPPIFYGIISCKNIAIGGNPP